MAQQFQETSAMHKMDKVQSLPAKEDKSILEARIRTFVNWINQWRRQDFDKEGAKVSRAKRAQNFDHAHLITSRAASRGMYVHTYVWPMDMIWDGAARSKLYSLSSP